MKKILLSLSILATTLISCSTSDDEGTTQIVAGELTGSATTNRTIALGNYTLNGIYTIESGVTVTFDAGSTVTANTANGVDAILVKNGGKLIMNGTASQPIILTESSQNPGFLGRNYNVWRCSNQWCWSNSNENIRRWIKSYLWRNKSSTQWRNFTLCKS